MYSVIIPTLWKSNRTIPLLQDLNNCEYVTDIILVDNTSSNKTQIQDLSKINYINPGKNLYVNPSWNLGVILSKEDNIIICNDDITFNPQLYCEILNQIHLQEIGIVGVASKNYELTSPTSILLHPKSNTEQGWGCLIALHKSNWVPIWFGDNFILENNIGKQFTLEGIPISTEMSTTSDLKEFDEVKQQDIKNWDQIWRNII
jgi:hypothetical protein